MQIHGFCQYTNDKNIFKTFFWKVKGITSTFESLKVLLKQCTNSFCPYTKDKCILYLFFESFEGIIEYLESLWFFFKQIRVLTVSIQN